MPPHRPMSRPGEKPDKLKDPCEDRPVKEVPLPPSQLLTREALFGDSNVPDINVLTEHLDTEGLLSQELLLDLISMARELFSAEPNMLKLQDPITVVGDIHGQYYDLVKLFDVGGQPGEVQYIFLGDYVDRGSYSIEVIALLYSFKIAFPKSVRMLRGNHECRQMTAFFNFREECEHKYDISIYDAIMDSFDTLPLAATINGRFLAVHGGLSPELPTLKSISGLNRFQEPPKEGLICDLLWSDPLDSKDGGAAESKNSKKKAAHFINNEVRGCSYFFSYDAVVKFLQKNSLLSMIRAHEAQLEGYKMHKTNPGTGFPSMITIFSAPNYCDVYNNKAAILKFDNSTLNILQFNCSPHPYHLPNFMDVFTWSMPFVIEKVTEMLYYILSPPAGSKMAQLDAMVEDLPELPETVKNSYRASLSAEQNETVALATRLASFMEGDHDADAKTEKRDLQENRERMRKKVRTIAKMARMFKTMRQENEAVIRLGGVCPGHKLNPGLLLAGKDAQKSEADMFGHAHDVDLLNEMRPHEENEELPHDEGGRDFMDEEPLQKGSSETPSK